MSVPTSRRLSIAFGVFALLVFLRPAAASEDTPDRPRLVLMITVDQLRGDMLPRFEERFDAGFRRLLEQGFFYTNASYAYATTFTAVGHATLATGASPIDHGIVGNGWFEPGRGDVYCVEDEQHGRSPRNLTSTTVGDELIMATGGVARVFSVSVKDRAAILPGGHLGKAFWYAPRSGRFVTSSYYYDGEPPWLTAFNEKDLPREWVGRSWTLLHPPSSYVFGDQDDRPYETGGSLGNTFPHPLGDNRSAVSSNLRKTPFGDELLLELTKSLIEAEHLGQASGTDLLAVSFSASDYVGHSFGPNSLEAEDNLLRLDRTLGELLQYVAEHVGLDRTLVVLSSDHGVDAVPAHRRELLKRAQPARRAPNGAQDHSAADHDFCVLAGHLVGNELRRQANDHLKERFGGESDLVVAYGDPGFYLDVDAIARLEQDVRVVEGALAEFLRRQPGVARAFPRTDLLRGTVPTDAVAQRVLRSFHPDRSASVTIVQSQGWYLWEQPGGYAAMHGSPYSYDTHVPIVLLGAGIPAGRSARAVTPQDIAPTLSRILGILAPSGCSGEVLLEAMPQSQAR